MNTRDLFTRYVLDHHALPSTNGKAVQDVDETPDPVVVAGNPSRPAESVYPQVIVMQGRDPAARSDVRTGQVLALAGLGVLALAGLAIVALVAVAVALAAVTCTVAMVAIKAMAATSQSHGGRWSR